MRYTIIILVVLQIGCSGIGYVATSDPNHKIRQAYSLMAEDRLLLAEDMIRQAMVSFESAGDKPGMAEAYHAYGNLYKNGLYINGRWKAKFEEMGTYDGTFMKSITNFSKCQDLYAEIGNGFGEAKCLLGGGNAYSLKGEAEKACDYYKKSLAAYNTAKQDGSNFQEPQMLTGYANLGELVEAFIKTEDCDI
ncbi:MAG: hypothetical protein ABW092_09605 [Candidatus Thiodiazotropha sp.]